jgi:phosphoenolpyruvate carboxylase
MQGLARVLESVGQGEVAGLLPWQALWRGMPAPPVSELPVQSAEACLQAFSISFQLLNLAEENAVVQARRATAPRGDKADESGSWEQALAHG